MGKEARAKVADRMLGEIEKHLARTLPPGIGAQEEVWEATEFAGEELRAAVLAWERGEISYAELQAAGTRLVEAWGDAAAASRVTADRIAGGSVPS